MSTEHFEYIIIGAGPGGYDIAAELAAEGKKVAVVERDLPGGTCLNRGCIPTKCLCASAERLLELRDMAEFGIEVPEGVRADYGKAVEREIRVVSQLRDSVAAMLGKCAVYEGTASLEAGHQVKVTNADREEALLSADRIIIATGSKPAVIPIEGAELTISSDDFLKLTELPKRLVVMGGGVIGMEFASIANAFGSEVTVVEYCKEILPPFDKDIAKRLRSMISRRGVKFVTGAGVKSVAGQPGALIVSYEGKKGLETIECDAVLMSTGRRPVVPEGCDKAGVNLTQRGFIEVNPETMETSAEGIYAVGDVNGLCMLAHAATAQARRAVGKDVDLGIIPAAVFTTPEAAMVGLTEDACKERGLAYKVGKASYASNGKALASGHGDGTVKVIYAAETGQVLGCFILGAHASDLIQEIATAMYAKLTVNEINISIVHGHPTLGEIVAAACR